MAKTLALTDMPLSRLIEDACWVWNTVVKLGTKPRNTKLEDVLYQMLVFQTYHLDQLLREKVGIKHNHYKGLPTTPNDQLHIEGSTHMTLNELLEILDVKIITIYVPITPRLKARIDVRTTSSAELDDVTFHYGGQSVKRISPVFKGDDRVVVELA